MRAGLPNRPSRSPRAYQSVERHSFSLIAAHALVSKRRSGKSIRTPGKHGAAGVIPASLLTGVIDAVDDSGLVVGDEQGAVRRDDDVDRASGGVVALQPALCEGLVAHRAAVLQLHHRDAIASLRIAVPRAVLRDEDGAAVFLGELGAGVEAHAERGDVRPELLRGRRELLARALPAEFRIGHVAAMAIGEAEIHG